MPKKPSLARARTITRFATHCLLLLIGVLIAWRQAASGPMRALAGVALTGSNLELVIR